MVTKQQKNVVKLKKRVSSVKIGDMCDLKITALGENNIGIDEFTYSFPVFVPKVQTVGTKVKAKIVKMKDSLYAIALPVAQSVKNTQGRKGTQGEVSNSATSAQKAPVTAGDILTVTIEKHSAKGAGIVELSPNYKLIVPLWPGETLPKTGQVKVTRVKSNYAFGDFTQTSKNSSPEGTLSQKGVAALKEKMNVLRPGCKFTTTLPEKVKRYGKYIILKGKGLVPTEHKDAQRASSILFVKLEKGVKLGRAKVRIKVTSTSTTCAIGKIVKVNPVPKKKKTTLVMNNIREMLAHSMHYGEKAVKCHARMKPYIWLKKQGQNKNRQQSPLIKKGRHVINLLKTRRCLNNALNSLTKYALKGRTFLFIGTKKPATGLVARAAHFTKNSFYVNTRWLGGMLTNWKTICKSISKIRPILKEKQKVVRDILERRQTIKSRLIQKALLLKNKSKLILTKGRYLLEMFKKNAAQKNERALRVQKLAGKRNEFITKGMNYIQKRQKLIQKRRELIYQTLLLKEKGLQLSYKYKNLLNQLAAYNKKLREYKYLLKLTTEIQQLQKNNVSLYSVSYGNLKNTQNGLEFPAGIIPNPPKEILNRIVLTMKNQTSSSQMTSKATKGNIVVCSSLLLNFASQYSSYIKSVITAYISGVEHIKTQCNQISLQLKNIQATLQKYLTLKNQYVAELQQLKAKFVKERGVIQILKRKLKTLDARAKLAKFLPRLRYLPTPQTKISEIVHILLTKIVDPKLKFPIDNIYDQKLSSQSKKQAAARKKKWQRLEKYFGGIAKMTKLSKTKISQNVAIIIGQKEEMNAVRECQKLGIKTFTIVDTNCNPTLSQHIIPANDDSRNSIKYILGKFITRIRLAQKIRTRFLKFQKTK